MNFLERLRGQVNSGRTSPDQRPVSTTSFEQELFHDGVLVFNHDGFIADATERYQRSRAWYNNNPYWDEQRTVRSLARDTQEIRHEYAWQRHFSGQVPRNWDTWYNAQDAFEKAGRRDVQLSETLVNAGVSYDHHLVAHATGKNQRLNVTQIAFIFVRDLPEWNRQDILAAQRAKGVTEDEIRQAEQMARDVLSRRRSSGITEEGFLNLALPNQGK